MVGAGTASAGPAVALPARPSTTTAHNTAARTTTRDGWRIVGVAPDHVTGALPRSDAEADDDQYEDEEDENGGSSAAFGIGSLGIDGIGGDALTQMVSNLFMQALAGNLQGMLRGGPRDTPASSTSSAATAAQQAKPSQTSGSSSAKPSSAGPATAGGGSSEFKFSTVAAASSTPAATPRMPYAEEQLYVTTTVVHCAPNKDDKSAGPTTMRMRSISAMPMFQHFSFEELRDAYRRHLEEGGEDDDDDGDNDEDSPLSSPR